MKTIFRVVSIIALLLLMSACATVTPLGRAAKSGDIKEVKSLLSKGANVNEIVIPGDSPLHEAVFNNAPLDIISLLIDKGADLNKQSCGDGWATTCNCSTPLNIAACRGYANIVKLLLDRGANIDGMDRSGYTPLASAAEQGQSAMVRLLIERGADPDIAKGFLLSQDKNSAVQLIDLMAKSAHKGRTQIATSRADFSPAVKSDVDQLPAIEARTNSNAYAIVIGIEQYRQKLPKADFAVHDAQTITRYLTKVMGYPEENIVTLLNDRAAKSDFEKYFEKWLGNNAQAGGTVFVYFSGHGAPDPQSGSAYLVPYDGDPSFIDQTGYSLKRMYDALGKLPARRIVVALDCCFSGAGGRSVIAKGARPLVINLQKSMVPSKNITVLSASSAQQISSTYEEKGHGLFTYFLLEGIKSDNVVNPDGSLKIDDLFHYLKPRVERIARKDFNNEQTPQLIETVRK